MAGGVVGRVAVIGHRAVVGFPTIMVSWVKCGTCGSAVKWVQAVKQGSGQG